MKTKTTKELISDGQSLTAATRIRAYLRKELLAMNEKAKTGKRVAFTRDQITIEIERRDALEDARRDTLRYPELQTYFR